MFSSLSILCIIFGCCISCGRGCFCCSTFCLICCCLFLKTIIVIVVGAVVVVVVVDMFVLICCCYFDCVCDCCCLGLGGHGWCCQHGVFIKLLVFDVLISMLCCCWGFRCRWDGCCFWGFAAVSVFGVRPFWALGVLHGSCLCLMSTTANKNKHVSVRKSDYVFLLLGSLQISSLVSCLTATAKHQLCFSYTVYVQVTFLRKIGSHVVLICQIVYKYKFMIFQPLFHLSWQRRALFTPQNVRSIVRLRSNFWRSTRLEFGSKQTEINQGWLTI